MDDANQQQYTVTIEVTLSYDIVVDAESFNDAAERAIDQSAAVEDALVSAANRIVPEEVLNYWDSRVRGVHNQA